MTNDKLELSKIEEMLREDQQQFDELIDSLKEKVHRSNTSGQNGKSFSDSSLQHQNKTMRRQKPPKVRTKKGEYEVSVKR